MLIVLAVVIGLNSCAVTVDEMSTLKNYALSDMRKELEGRDVSILYESPQGTILSKQNLSGGVRKFRFPYATPNYTANVTANVNRHDTICSNSLTLENADTNGGNSIFHNCERCECPSSLHCAHSTGYELQRNPSIGDAVR